MTPNKPKPDHETMPETQEEKNADSYNEDANDLNPTLYESAADTEETEATQEQENRESAQIQALQNELDKAKDISLRALAEAENARKRAAREKVDAANFAISSFARDLLGVADNLRRALEAVPQDLIESDARIQNLLEGIEATERELLKSFEKNGLKQINPEGEIFNPNYHEVMFEGPAVPGQQPGTVIQVIETGYVLNDRLLRPARVGVAKDENQTAANGTQNLGQESPRAGDNLDTEA